MSDPCYPSPRRGRRTASVAKLLTLCAVLLMALLAPLGALAQSLELAVATDRDPVQPGERFFFTATVTNSSGGTLSDVTVTGFFPDHVRDMNDGTTLPDINCPGGICDSGETLTWTIGDLAPGQNRTLHLPLVVADDASQNDAISLALDAAHSLDANAASASETVTVKQFATTVSLEVAIRPQTNPVAPGASLTYTITYANSGQDTASGVTLTAVPPTGVTVDTVSDGGTVGIGTITWALGDLPAGGSGLRQFTVTGTPGSEGEILLAEARLADSSGGDIDTRASTATATRLDAPLAMAIAVDTDPVQPEQRYYYTVTVTNPSTTAFRENVTVGGFWPNHVQDLNDGVPLPDILCPGGICDAGERFTWTIGTLEPGQNRTLRLPMTVTTSTDAGSLVNLYLRAGYDGKPDAALESFTSVVASPFTDTGLELRIAPDRNPVAPNETLGYTITYGNHSQDTVSGVTLTALLPEGTTLDSAGDGGTAVNGSVSWNLGDIPAGGSGLRRFSIGSTPTGDGQILLAEARLADDNGDGFDTRGSTATATRSDAPLALAVAVDTDPVLPDQRYYYTITVINTTTGSIRQNVTVGSHYPNHVQDMNDGVPLPDISCPGGICDAGERFTWSVGTLNPGQSQTLRLPMTLSGSVDAGNLVDLRFRVGDDQKPDATVESFTSTVASPFTDAGLELRIAADQNPLAPGGQLTYTVTYANRSAGAISGVSLTALPPDNASVDTASDDGTVGGDTVSWDLGEVPAGSGGRRQFTVTDTTGQTGQILLAEARVSDGSGSGFDRRSSTATVTRMDPPLSLEIAVDNDPVLPGEAFQYTVTVSNTSATQFLENVAVGSHFPHFVQDINDGVPTPDIACPGGICDSGERYTWNIGDLTPGQTAQLQLPVTIRSDTDRGSLIHSQLAAIYPVADITQAVIEQRTVLIGDEHTATPLRSGAVDIDCSGDTGALSDGILAIRYIFGFRGNTLTAGVLGNNPTCDTAAIETYLADNLDVFDVDGNGQVMALTDGILLIRYLFGFRGDSLITGAIGAGATRTTAADIEAYIQGNLL